MADDNRHTYRVVTGTLGRIESGGVLRAYHVGDLVALDADEAARFGARLEYFSDSPHPPRLIGSGAVVERGFMDPDWFSTHDYVIGEK